MRSIAIERGLSVRLCATLMNNNVGVCVGVCVRRQ